MVKDKSHAVGSILLRKIIKPKGHEVAWFEKSVVQVSVFKSLDIMRKLLICFLVEYNTNQSPTTIVSNCSTGTHRFRTINRLEAST